MNLDDKINKNYHIENAGAEEIDNMTMVTT